MNDTLIIEPDPRIEARRLLTEAQEHLRDADRRLRYSFAYLCVAMTINVGGLLWWWLT